VKEFQNLESKFWEISVVTPMTHKEATLSMKHAHGTPLMIALVAFASLTAISGTI